jgi:hypothetical protein
MMEKFRDIVAFCQQVSCLMVSEMRRRASNQSTEAGSCAIVKLLETENSEESSNGWMFLSTLNLFAAGDVSLVQVRPDPDFYIFVYLYISLSYYVWHLLKGGDAGLQENGRFQDRCGREA